MTDTYQLALFGHPVSHSPSPKVHGMFARQFGLDVDYRLIEALPDTFSERLGAFREGGGRGCNITLPLKALAFEQADEITPRAGLAGAANTLWWGDDGRCHADNTDGYGLVRDIERNVGFDIRGTRILLLGAGGAAAGVLGALLEQGPAHIAIVNRTLERARALAKRHEGFGHIETFALEEADRVGDNDLLIDATAMGHSGASPPAVERLFEGVELCYSLSYGEAARSMRAISSRAGVSFRDGLGMLVEQAAESFEIWTGCRPECRPVHDQLRGNFPAISPSSSSAG